MNRAFLASASLLIWSSLAVSQALAGQPATTQPVQSVPSRAMAEPARPPVDPALKAALDGVEASNPVARFYAARDYKLAWSKSDLATLNSIVNDAQRQALNPKDYQPDLARAHSAEDRDIAYTRAALDYANALAMGKVDPTSVEEIFTLHRNVIDTSAGLNDAIEQGKVQAWFAALPPDDKGYQGLTSAYLHFRDIAIKGGWPVIRPGAVIRPGSKDPRVPAIAARLLAEGDLDHPFTGTTYSDDLVEAMKIFQQRHGVPDDGIIGADTQDELQATAEDRARQVATNLERRRWLARTVADERIDVNTAASILVYWKDGKPVGRNVINGRSNKPTPSLEASFSTILADPPWNVPADIAKAEIFPKGAGYLAAEDMYIAADGHVVQRAGPKSALGLVKFEVQDPYAIYLHDTPSRSLFAHYQRHLSHGCVRVEDAVEFARLLLADNPDALAEFDQAESDHDTKRVQMGREIPVRMLYWTAFMTGADRVAFRKDVYGWDSKLGEALGVGALSFKSADRTKQTDVGP
ncbi:MAG TPA: L,D-transpeptidase family protein [Caulobacteraceae bacterium]|jgi:murein L,D-transpeptidase YcbB/YkuD|nr:L,D-transpeptidase family protein [Caulobacteraceae bacterium]